MRSFAFIFRSLLLSLAVGLRMIPILLASGYALYMLAVFFADEPVALIFVFVLVNVPLSIFLYIVSVRCGLVQLKATGAPVVKKLLDVTWQFLRLNLPIYILCIKVIGIGGSILVVKFLAPDVWHTLFEDFSMSMVTRPLVLLEAITSVPMLIIPMFALANAVAIAAMGTNVAAKGDAAAIRGPFRDQIWGIGAQFTKLLMLGILVLVAPWLVVIAQTGNPLVGIGSLFLMSETFYIALPIYNAWSYCAMAAGMALAYVYTLQDMERDKVMEQAALDGHIFDKEDLRALRASRQRSMDHVHG